MSSHATGGSKYDPPAATSTPYRTDSCTASANQRSCVACAKRKVRCDKQYPCGRCQQAGVQCIQPQTSQRPRWARHLPSPSSSHAGVSQTRSKPTCLGRDQMLERLETVERLIRGLTDEQGVQVSASATSATQGPGSDATGGSSSTNVIPRPPQPSQHTFQDSDRVRDLSSSFWLRVEHELSGLREGILNYADIESESAGGQASPPELSSSSSSYVIPGEPGFSDRNFILQQAPLRSYNHDRSSACSPSPSQTRFLLEVYAESVQFVIGLPHSPSFQTTMKRRQAGDALSDSPVENALIAAVFYAAVNSLAEHEVASSFETSQHELSVRLCESLQHSLARADFLNNPCYELLEAVTVFMTIARLREPPKYTFMMTGIAIRMARYLGYHHDGDDRKNVTPFQVEMQRRLWWNICILDLRATEDHGTELTICNGSHSTKIPSNVNETDMTPGTSQAPVQRQGVTSTSLLRLCSKIARTTQEIMAGSTTDTIEDRVRRLTDLAEELNQDYFALPEATHQRVYKAAAGSIRICLGRLTLLAFLPASLSPVLPNSTLPMRNKLLVAAIEIVEHNHALNLDPSCQPWKWVYQTQQHWHAVVYFLLEICRRPWSSVVERAWLALQSPWLVPSRAPVYKSSNVWVPIKQLITAARKHREEEASRLQADSAAATILEEDDERHTPVLSSSTTFPTYFDDASFQKRWRRLFHPTSGASNDVSATHPILSDGCVSKAGPDTFTRTDAHSNSLDQMPISQDEQSGSGAAAPSVDDATYASQERPQDIVERNVRTALDEFFDVEAEISLQNECPLTDTDLRDFDWNGWFETVGERGSVIARSVTEQEHQH